MARLPQPGGDSGDWGSILNDFLSQAHNTDGSIKADVVGAEQIQSGLLENKVDKGSLVFNVKDYGAVGDGTTDDTAAIQAAINAATTAGASWPGRVTRPIPKVYAAGIYKTTGTITITCSVDFSQAVFWCYQTSGVAVQVGSTSSTLDGTTVLLPQVFAKAKTINGWSQVAGTTGVRVTNLYNCVVWLGIVTYFETGFWVHANGTEGTSYNEFHLTKIYGCKVGVKVAPNDTGSTSTSSWCNTNTFFGGVFGMSPLEGTRVSGAIQVYIPVSTWPVNDNKFIGMSLENSNNVEYMIDCGGNHNVWDRCRFENTGTPYVKWRSPSHSNVITSGINTENIVFETDAGCYNYGLALELTGYTTAARPQSLGIGGLAFDSTLGRPIFSSDGIVIKPVALQEDLINNIAGSGSPEGVVSAAVGTIYTRTDSGTRTNLCKYPIGDSVAATTGWAALGGTLTLGSGYLRNTLNASDGTVGRSIGSPNAATLPLPAGSTTYTFRTQARMSNPLPMQLRVYFYTSGGVQTGSIQVGSTATPGVSFGDLPSVTATAPADAAYALVVAAIPGGPPNGAGETLDIRHVIIEQGTTAGSWFDGSVVAGAGITYAWLGTSQASSSTATYAVTPISFVKTGTGNTGWKQLAPAGGVVVSSAATDATTTQTLVNEIRAALITHGILS